MRAFSVRDAPKTGEARDINMAHPTATDLGPVKGLGRDLLLVRERKAGQWKDHDGAALHSRQDAISPDPWSGAHVDIVEDPPSDGNREGSSPWIGFCKSVASI